MTTELDVLKRVSEGLSAESFPFHADRLLCAWLTNATPRMTRNLDFAVALAGDDGEALLRIFSSDFYIDADAVRAALENEPL